MSEISSTPEQLHSTVRQANLIDAEEIVSIHISSWLAAYPPLVEGLTETKIKDYFESKGSFDERIKKCKQRIEQPLDNTRQFVHISSAENKADGFIVAGDSPNRGDLKQIYALYVLPDSQGQGAGSQLMETALEYLESDKYPVRLTVVSNNQKAIGLYEKYGFSKSRDILGEEQMKIEGVIIPETEMLRPAGPLD